MSVARADAWRSLAISDIAVFGSGDLISVARLSARSGSHPVPVYGGNGIAGYTSFAMINQPTVILGRVGQKCGAVYRNDGPAWITDNALYARLFKRPLDVQFLAFALEAARLNDVKNRNDLPLITQSILNDVKIAWPEDLKEQRQIAEVMTDADDLIASLERMIVKKQAVKQGMMQQLLTGKTRLHGFTKPWLEGTFEQLVVPSKERAMPRSVPPTTPLVELEQIEGGTGRLIGKSQASDAISLKAVFRPGDVLFGKLRAYLRKFWYADVAGLCTTEIWVLRARTGVDGRFVRFVVETDKFIEAASGAYGTHMPRSDWGTVRRLSVGIPPHDEQLAISSVLADVDTEIGLLRTRLAKVRNVKLGMMQQLLTGRTRLPVKESADE